MAVRRIQIRRGLTLPMTGAPEPTVVDAPPVTEVAVIGSDYVGMKPTMEVREGDRVRLGQVLFTDKKSPGVRLTSPGAGEVVAVHRGAKRVLESVVIRLEGEDEESFERATSKQVTDWGREEIRDLLNESGLWVALRTRPYSKTPALDATPRSIFVTAIDTNPLAGPVDPVIAADRPSFEAGLTVLGRLTDGPVWVATAPDSSLADLDGEKVRVVEFAGPHPAGLPGTHIHHLDPVGPEKSVWHIGFQDVLAIGRLFRTGRLSVERVVSVAGSAITQPRVVRTRLGAKVDDLVRGTLADGDNRVISGSVYNGRMAAGTIGYLGRFHSQVVALPEGRERKFLGWMAPGFGTFSVSRAFAAALTPGKEVAFTTSRQGDLRAMVPLGLYEKVLPLDMEPTYLLRALIVGDTEKAQALGCLELDEEDLGLCTFVCTGKYDYGPILRESLTMIEREG